MMPAQFKLPNQLERYLPEIAIAALLLALYGPLMLHWVDGWLNKNINLEHEYFSHGLLGFPFAAFIAWEKRQQWEELRDRANPFGAVLMGLAAVFYLSGLWDLVNLSLPLLLLGLCIWLKGLPGLRLMGFPLLLIALATPNDLPYLIAPYTLPLQSFIAGVGGFILMQFGLDVTVENIYLLVGGRIVEVAPHCAGIKMLFTTLYVALMLLYWTGHLASRVTTIGFLISATLLSVTTNILRNTTLTFFHGTGKDDLFYWLHDSWGGDLISAFMLLMLVPTLMLVEHLVRSFSDMPQDEA
jgi:cyanoexosortase B